MVRRLVALGLVVMAVGAFLVVRPGQTTAEPTPTPIPTVATGRICVAAASSLSSCDGVAAHPSVGSREPLAFFIESPIYEDLYVHVSVSRVAVNVAAPEVKGFDIQAIPNPNGVGNTLGPAQSFDPSLQPGETVTYLLDAAANGRHIAQTTFTVTAAP